MNSIDKTPVATTMDYLLGIQQPAGAYTSILRVGPVELTQFSIDSTLVTYQLNTNSEYQFTLRSSNGDTLITTIPHPDCVDQNSPFYSAIKNARASIDSLFVVDAKIKSTSLPFQSTGIGFWQGQTGQTVTKNGIELRPLTALKFNPENSLTTFNEEHSNYLITKVAIGYTISDLKGNVLTTTNIARLKFAGVSVALDIDGIAGQAYRLYQAAFNRKPDMKGLGYWIQQMDRGTTLKQVAASFIASDEFKQLYGANPSYGTLINNMYMNVLHRAPDQAGYNYWIDQLTRGLNTPEVALAGFSESAENQAQVLPAIKNGIEYSPFP